MPFQFAYNVGGITSNPPVPVQALLSGTGAYNVGDLLTLDTTTGYHGTVAAGDPGTVSAVCAVASASGTTGRPGTVYLITKDQIWKCITNATTYSVNPGAGSVQVLNAGTINSTPGTTDHCILYATAIESGNTNISAYVTFPNTAF
jgi:hypothetical protein